MARWIVDRVTIVDACDADANQVHTSPMSTVLLFGLYSVEFAVDAVGRKYMSSVLYESQPDLNTKQQRAMEPYPRSTPGASADSIGHADKVCPGTQLDSGIEHHNDALRSCQSHRGGENLFSRLRNSRVAINARSAVPTFHLLFSRPWTAHVLTPQRLPAALAGVAIAAPRHSGPSTARSMLVLRCP